MRLKIKQIKFYCTEEYFKLLQSVKVRRGSTIQRLMEEAVIDIVHGQEGFGDAAKSPPLERQLTLDGGMEEYISVKNAEERHWVQMWIEFTRELPTETVDAQKQVIQDCLKFFRSSRLVAEPRKKASRKKVNGR
jgi:hypothetical protein